MSETIESLSAKLDEALEQIALIASAPMLSRFMADAGIKTRVKKVFANIAKLCGADTDERAQLLRSMPHADRQQCAELSSRPERIEILRGLDRASQMLLATFLTAPERCLIASVLIETDDLPALVSVMNSSSGTVRWMRTDSRSRHAGGRTLDAGQAAIYRRDVFEAELADIEDMQDHVTMGRLTVKTLDEKASRDWLARAVQEQVSFALAPNSLQIVAIDLDMPEGAEKELARDKRNAAKVRAADKAAIVESGHATIEAVKANGKLRAAKND